jgi:hypothetical protein
MHIQRKQLYFRHLSGCCSFLDNIMTSHNSGSTGLLYSQSEVYQIPTQEHELNNSYRKARCFRGQTCSQRNSCIFVISLDVTHFLDNNMTFYIPMNSIGQKGKLISVSTRQANDNYKKARCYRGARIWPERAVVFLLLLWILLLLLIVS